MLDHIFTDVVGTLRDSLENVHLERTVVDERFQTDVLLGDLTWTTSYALPGEGVPAKVRADISLAWPTNSQSAYRSWLDGADTATPPTVEVEMAFRVQELRTPPSLPALVGGLPATSPPIGKHRLERGEPTVETIYRADLSGDPGYAFETAYSGTYELDQASLADGPTLDAAWRPMGSWVSATLVALGEASEQYR